MANGTLVAKYVERKMSPTTGLDTDYTYEWKLVKHADPNEIYKGGKYGIYRSLTVNGEVRYNDLMGFGDTPTEAAHATPVETVLEKAEKFGVLKTKFDKEVAEQRTGTISFGCICGRIGSCERNYRESGNCLGSAYCAPLLGRWPRW